MRLHTYRDALTGLLRHHDADVTITIVPHHEPRYTHTFDLRDVIEHIDENGVVTPFTAQDRDGDTVTLPEIQARRMCRIERVTPRDETGYVIRSLRDALNWFDLQHTVHHVRFVVTKYSGRTLPLRLSVREVTRVTSPQLDMLYHRGEVSVEQTTGRTHKLTKSNIRHVTFDHAVITLRKP